MGDQDLMVVVTCIASLDLPLRNVSLLQEQGLMAVE